MWSRLMTTGGQVGAGSGGDAGKVERAWEADGGGGGGAGQAGTKTAGGGGGGGLATAETGWRS